MPPYYIYIFNSYYRSGAISYFVVLTYVFAWFLSFFNSLIIRKVRIRNYVAFDTIHFTYYVCLINPGILVPDKISKWIGKTALAFANLY